MQDEAPERREPTHGAASVGVLRAGGTFRLVATAPIESGAEVMRIEGRLTSRPSRTSVQIGDDLHVDVPEGLDLERVLDTHAWRFMNHACDPTVRLAGRAIVALRRIAAGEEITFDYNTTELDMSTPFVCACGAPACRRAPVRGFAHLSPDEQRRLLPSLAEHLRRRVAEGAPRP